MAVHGSSLKDGLETQSSEILVHHGVIAKAMRSPNSLSGLAELTYLVEPVDILCLSWGIDWYSKST